MRENEFDGFVDVIQPVAEQYGKRLSESVLALYWVSLKEYDLAAVRDALGRHLRNTDTGQFMPKVADIIRMMQGSSADAAFSAWSKVDNAVRRVGPYESIVFDDPIIHKVLHDMGGWILLCEKDDEAWPFIKNEFVTRFRGFKSRNERVEYPAKLIGIAEAHNGQNGHRIASPVLIGNPHEARAVLESGLCGGSLLGITKLDDFVAMQLPERIGHAEN